MWPMRLEMTRDECRKCLRYLELDAYGSIVSVLRAQGPFTNEKQKLLQEIAKMLNISNERHRAEVRRAVNDEKLATIAEQLNGPNTGTDWTIEGRRTIPLLPRLKARSAFTTLANSLSLAAAFANAKCPDRPEVIPRPIENITGSLTAETESQPVIKREEDMVDPKLCSLENKLSDSTTLQENPNSNEVEELVDNKDADEKVSEMPKISKLLGKRKSLSPLLEAPPNKVTVISSDSSEMLNHIVTDKATFENDVEEPQDTTQHQNVKLIPLAVEISGSKESEVSESTVDRPLVPANKHTSTIISECISNANKPKTIVSFMQNKLSTKITSVTSNDASNTATLNKVQTENADAQSQDNANDAQKIEKSENTSPSPSCIKRVPPAVHANTVVSKSVISSNTHRVMAVHPGTTVSSGPGPPQVKQAAPLLTCKKWPSEQNATFSPQSTAKMSVTINSTKAVNIPHHSNTKLTAKTNVIVIQKGHAKGVTLSHAGKEVLGKVIMGGKNLCVTSQHNASSVNVLPHHVSLNGDQTTTTTLPAANPPNAESVKTNIKSGNTIVFNLRQDIFEKTKVLSQHLESSGVLNSEPKTVIQSRYTRLLTEDSNSDASTIDSCPKTDSVITSTTEEKQQHSKNEDVNASVNSQVVNSLDILKVPAAEEILVKPTQLASVQDDVENDTRTQESSENADMFDATLESTSNANLESPHYLETVTVNHVDECNNS